MLEVVFNILKIKFTAWRQPKITLNLVRLMKAVETTATFIVTRQQTRVLEVLASLTNSGSLMVHLVEVVKCQ